MCTVRLPEQANSGKTARSLIRSSPSASCLLVSTVPSPGQVVYAKPRQEGGNKTSSSANASPFKGHGHREALVPARARGQVLSGAPCSFRNKSSDGTCLGKRLLFQTSASGSPSSFLPNFYQVLKERSCFEFASLG